MRRFGLLAFAAFLLLQCSGVVALLDDDACAPLCTDCACCPALRSDVPPPIPAPAPGECRLLARRDARRPVPDTQPADIFHVPRRAA